MKDMNKIKTALVDNHLSQNDLATEMNMAKSTISLYCTNKRQPTLKSLFKMAEFIGVNTCQLINE